VDIIDNLIRARADLRRAIVAAHAATWATRIDAAREVEAARVRLDAAERAAREVTP
jgi:hypothetical protein